MTEHTLNAVPRTDLGKGAARKSRAGGGIPAVVYAAGSEALAITVDPKQVDDIFRTTRNKNTIVQISLGDKKVPALVQEAQRHPVSREIIHIDFYQVSAERPVRVDVPVTTSGKAVGIALGGRIRVVRRELTVVCPFDKIPATLDVDVTPLDIGQFVKVSQVVAPEGVTVVFDTDFNVVACEGKAK